MKTLVLVAGICGRVGGRVADVLSLAPDMTLAAGVESPEHPSAGGSVTVSGVSVRVFAGFSEAVPAAEVVVDFTSPRGTREALAFCVERRIPLVSGTTGLGEEDFRSLRAAAGRIPVLVSPNMSRGVNLIDRVLPEVRRMAGDECDVEIVEKHHRAKKDSPSGTAIRLAETLAESVAAGRKVVIHSVRAGDVVGEHTVILGLRGERIEIKHVAESRDCFAHGAVACVRFLLDKAPGWYTMNDVLAGASPSQKEN
jgi:4-hydroxy-tetrahydrodipicolinate reductase